MPQKPRDTATPSLELDDLVPMAEHGHEEDEEKLLAGRPDVNYPALLTKDVPGG